MMDASSNLSDKSVFVSYVREDSVHVDCLEVALRQAGIPVWRDTAELWPGQDWRAQIRRAITSDALVFLACFSRASSGKAVSYQNDELLLAIEQLRLRPAGVTWLIPVRFNECQIPDLDIGGGRTLAVVQRADLIGGRREQEMQRLVATIQRMREDHGSGAAELPTATGHDAAYAGAPASWNDQSPSVRGEGGVVNVVSGGIQLGPVVQGRDFSCLTFGFPDETPGSSACADPGAG
jgi:hypothetical protein